MKKLLLFIVQLFMITAAVMLGVYLGLKGYTYDQQLKEGKEAKTTTLKIEQEMKLNAGQVSLALDYHKTVKDTLDFLRAMKDNQPFQLKRIPLWQGIKAPILRNAAYHEAMVTQQLAYLPPTLLSPITQIYVLQKELQGISSPTVAFLLQQHLRDKNRRQETTKIIEQLVRDYYKAENQLIQLYNQTFKLIRENKKK